MRDDKTVEFLRCFGPSCSAIHLGIVERVVYTSFETWRTGGVWYFDSGYMTVDAFDLYWTAPEVRRRVEDQDHVAES